MTGTSKTIAERLEPEQRSMTGHDVDALRELAGELFCDFLAAMGALGEDMRHWAGRIRDAEKGATGSKSTPLPEGIEWPRFEDGELVKLGDEFEFDGIKHTADILTHRKPDTQEDIDADAAKDPCVYFNDKTPEKCADCNLHNGNVDFDFEVAFTECRTAMNRDLLRRQRKLKEEPDGD